MKFTLRFANLVLPDPADAHRVVGAAEPAGFVSPWPPCTNAGTVACIA